jgi:hypothetical protein
VATYFADTSFWMALSRKRDQYNRHAIAWNQFVIRTRSGIVTTEAVLWEWLNGFSDASTRGVAAEGYRRAHADPASRWRHFSPNRSTPLCNFIGRGWSNHGKPLGTIRAPRPHGDFVKSHLR